MWQLDWLFPVSLFLTSNKTDSYDINELLLKTAINVQPEKAKQNKTREREREREIKHTREISIKTIILYSQFNFVF